MLILDQVFKQTLWLSSDSTKAGISYEKTSVPSREEHLVLDVGIERPEVLPGAKLGWTHEKLSHAFDCALNPKPSGSLNYTGFSAAAWSPLGCDRNKRCGENV